MNAELPAWWSSTRKRLLADWRDVRRGDVDKIEAALWQSAERSRLLRQIVSGPWRGIDLDIAEARKHLEGEGTK
jgi:hypothetical protein